LLKELTADSARGIDAPDVQCKECEYRELEDPDYDEDEP
jgi:hypothetical protein